MHLYKEMKNYGIGICPLFNGLAVFNSGKPKLEFVGFHDLWPRVFINAKLEPLEHLTLYQS